MKNKVYISSLNNSLKDQILSALEWINWEDIIKKNSRVFIKPNFTFPFYKPGVTTSPELIDALLAVLSKKTKNITVGETDGAGLAWTAEEAFKGHDLPKICKKYDTELVNLSKTERKLINFKLKKTTVALELPLILLKSTDVFITIPVPKMHCLTKVSLGIKNQWGCIPFAERRFKYHVYFDELVCELNRTFNPQIVIGDCSYMLTGNGPMFGEELKMDMLVVANDLGSFELTMLHLMGLNKWNISHINKAKRLGIVPESLDNIEFNTDWTRFASNKFFLKRTIQNYIALLGFKSRFITWLLYESPLAKPLHDILYTLKGNPLREAIKEKQRNK